ncbi:hypothetical protein B0T25DRAFT_462560 [Lasiosphaeria hispida]|uniref:DUF7580 domain-containing protein n=1 Tax=Lasiosphaeria hispida TaxID=260671 RepID=A0AAJ0M8X5_9PEZI|nr:hypothetical protein B0T25DRAFT_462560 [Lasiosphaeria hispida]
MLHPDCKVEKKGHFLENCPEWRMFSEVKPIFASTALRWSIAGADVSSATVTGNHTADGSSEDTRRLITLRNAFDLFREELQMLPSCAPDRDIECGPFDRCQKNLAKVLDLLDTFVKDSALGTAQAIHRATGEPAAVSSGGSQPVPKPRGFREWVRRKVPKKPANQPQPQVAPQLPQPMRPAVHYEKYSKLKALGKLAKGDTGDDLDDFQTACLLHLRLVLNADECIKAMNTIRDFNVFFESSKISGTSNPKDVAYPLSFPTTNWRDRTASDALGRLFSVICRRSEDTSCVTPKGTWRQHETMMRLCGSQLDERPLVFSVFFRFCNTLDSWQPIHLIPKDEYDIIRREDIYDLCSYARNHHQDEVVNKTVPSLVFDDDQLLVNLLSSPPIRPDAWPARSFRQLIEENVIRDRFEDGDKAVLALSLARCLLNIPRFHSSGDPGPWTDLLLTSDSVQFLHRASTSEILDVHHPYVHYFTCQNQHYQENGETQADRYRPTLVSLARFLLEIHLGHDLNVEFSSCTNIDDVKNKLFDIVDAEKLNYTRKHYLDAVRGCLNFRASLNSELRAQRQQEEPGDLVRRVICSTVVQPLERNLSVVNKYQYYLARRNLRLDGLAHQSAYPDVDASINNQQRPRRRSTIRSPPLTPANATPQVHSSGSNEGDMGIMFDGRAVSPGDK